MVNIGLGMIGGGFMGKLHSLAISSYPKYYYPNKANVDRVCLVDINKEIAEAGMIRFGFRRCETDWRKLLDDGEITAIDILTPNDYHKDIVLEAIKAKKNIYCEKPLAMNGNDAHEMYEAAQKAGIIHAVGYNNRALSAVRMVKNLIDRNALGDIYSIQMRYVQSWGLDSEAPMQWRFDSKRAGSGAIGDTGTHILDIARYLIGDVERVSAISRTFVRERNIAKNALLSKAPSKNEILGKQKVDVDDDMKALIEFKSGVSGTLFVSRSCIGHEDTLDFEIYGSKGAVRFSRERPNELEYCNGADPSDEKGFKTIKMGPEHPNGELWPMADLGIGYVEQKCVDMKCFFDAITENDQSLVNSSFFDGYKVCQIVDAIIESANNNCWVSLGND